MNILHNTRVKEVSTHRKRREKQCLHQHMKTDDFCLGQELFAYESGYLPSTAKRGNVCDLFLLLFFPFRIKITLVYERQALLFKVYTI